MGSGSLRAWLRLVSITVLAVAGLFGCKERSDSLRGIGGSNLPPTEVPETCSIPTEGCPCETEGQELDCGSLVEDKGDSVMCSVGKRVCTDGVWGACGDTHLEEKSMRGGSFSFQPLALGGSALCPPTYSPCDPYCNYFNDVPDSSLAVPSGFKADSNGVTLLPTGGMGCSSIAIVPSATQFTVTSLAPFTTNQSLNTIGMTVVPSPAGCVPATFPVTWTIDNFDRAQISGSTNLNGSLRLAVGVAGSIRVTAFGAGQVASQVVTVRVNVVDLPTVGPSDALPNTPSTVADRVYFGSGCGPGAATDLCRSAPLPGTASPSTVTFLYPYANTWFPLGMIAPVVQYTYSTTSGNDKAVKLSLRYPVGRTLAHVAAGTVPFNYSLIVRETNNFARKHTGASLQPLDPQVMIPQVAWSAFEQTVRENGPDGDDADILVQRLNGTALEVEARLPIHFVDGQLKGTVYYNSYNSVAGGSTSSNVIGAVLKISPGDTSSVPTPAVPGSYGKCTICHSVSASGTTLTFASGDAVGGSACAGAVATSGSYRENTCSWTMPAATAIKTNTNGSIDPYKFLWGAPYPDGSFYLNNVWDNTRILENSYPSGTGSAAPGGLYRTADGAALSVSNPPASPVTPAFSSDGTMVAYNRGNLNNSSGSIANPAVVVSENAACGQTAGVRTSEVQSCGQPYGMTLSEISACAGPAVSEVSACGQAKGLTLSEVASCPGLGISEISACGAASGVNVSEVASCGYTPSVNISEVSACSGLTLSEIQSCGMTPTGVVLSEVQACNAANPASGVVIGEILPCALFGGGTGEAVELRNNGTSPVNIGNWTVRASAATTCMTVAAGTILQPGDVFPVTRTANNCLGDTSGSALLYNSAGVAQNLTGQSRTYTHSAACTSGSPRRSVQSCAGVWSENNTGNANDTSNNNCAEEAVEIRNDSPNSVDVSNYTIRNGATTCATVPAGTTLGPGLVYRAFTVTGNCLTDAGATLTVNNGSGTLVSSRTYASACTAQQSQRSALNCAGTFTNNIVANGNDTTNDNCSTNPYEWVEVRNDTPQSINIGGYTVRHGAANCLTIPTGTTIGQGASLRFFTTSGTCFSDTAPTVSLNNGGGTLVASHNYTSTCTVGAPSRAVFACTGLWSDAVAGAGNDTTNDTCDVDEAVDIRNDSPATVNVGGWTVRNASNAVCYTIPAGTTLAPGIALHIDTTTGQCLADSNSSVSLYDSGGALRTTKAYTYSCSPDNPRRSALSCAQVWTENLQGAVFDGTNNSCAASQSFEAVEIRNDTTASVSIANWTVRNGAGTTCVTVPAATTLAAGAVYRTTTTTGACFVDAGDTVRIFDSLGVAQGSRAFTSTCTAAAPRRGALDCNGAWTDNVVGGTDDTSNNSCGTTTAFEFAEIRNDTNATIAIGGYSVRNGGTTCGTVPPATNLAAGAVYRVFTGGSCFPDAGGSLTLNDVGGTARATRPYTSTCTTAAPRRSVLSCAGTWTDSVAGGSNDTTNDSCTNREGVDIRNDTSASMAIGNYTIRNAGTAAICSTVPAGTTLAAGATFHADTGMCLTDGSGTVTVNDTAGTVVATKAYNYSCTAAQPRSVLSCTGTWSEGVIPATSAFDTTNDSCAASQVFETVEIRNDTPVALSIANWTIRNGGGTICATIPAGTTVAIGSTYRTGTTTGTCLADGTDTVRLYNSAGTQVASRAYTNTGCTVAAPRRSVMSCAGAWTENQAGGTDDTSNNSCSNFEAVEIRNDTAAAINPNGWLIKAGTGCGGTTCATVPNGSIAAGAMIKVNTNTGTCLSDSNGTVTLCNGTTPVSSRTYSYSCEPSNPLRSVLGCTGTWTDSVAGSAFDTANNTCTGQIFEAVELRNDTPSSQNLTGWTIRNGGTTCLTLPATTLAAGTSWRGYTNTGSCLTDGTGTVTVFDADGNLQNTQGYASACGTHGLLNCAGTWTNSVAGQAPDASNDTCSGTFEFIELRNDTAGSMNIGGFSARVGATTCFTVPAGTTLASGGVYQGATTSGTCMPDAGGTISVYDAGGAIQSSQAYTSTCTTSAPNRGVLTCAGAWSNNNSGGTAVASNNNCALSASYNASGTTLRVRDFTCGAAAGSTTCGAATKTFSNERTVVDCADAVPSGRASCTRPANPTFLPDKSGLLYQHQIVNSGFESYINSTYGAGAEIWITRTNAKGMVPLDNLNGWSASSGAVYIPTRPRHANHAVPTGSSAGIVYDVNWHRATSGNTLWVGDTCSYTNQTVTSREDRLNYYPTVSPQEAGNKYWAIFTSRRLYGNIAVSNPWQVQRSNATNKFGTFSGSCNTNALNAFSPGSGFVETKKLWVSAIDKNWSGSGDPSKPPFYLPGQELDAGNSHGYWAATPCAGDGAACDTNDDCCGGTGASPTFQCRVTNVSTVPATKACQAVESCSSVNEACTTTDDCCTGLVCPDGGGVCLALSGGASTKTYTREYIASCPEGTQPRWQNFEWQATLPTGTALSFFVQTKKRAGDTYQPAGTMTAPGLAIGSAPGTTAAGAWDKTTKTVDAFLRTADLSSLPYLMVSMVFRPTTSGTTSPTLRNWRQVYDCLPAE